MSQMIDGSECGIVSHLQLIFGSLHYGETCGKFPKPPAQFCLPVMGPSRGKEACRIYSGNGTAMHAFSVAERVFLVTKNFAFGAGDTIFQLNQRPFKDKCGVFLSASSSALFVASMCYLRLRL
ncbi:hypothetical protein CDAR_268841 [Caerostris darwini]|uniref:Uncharacterized protein n=1 Tax=Caerostris darwini TaxID=1538125 RepID=A0AAV4V546_9ARAC|nr:hypothetical protein CDAR_268841 [Caerostris darwini]